MNTTILHTLRGTTLALLLAVPGILCQSCNKDPEYNLSWLDEFDTDLPESIAWFNEKYELEMTDQIDQAAFLYDGNEQLGTEFTPATDQECIDVAEFLDKTIFPLFPEGFIPKYMPQTIYVASDVTIEHTEEIWDYIDGKMKKTTTDASRQLYGEIGMKHLTLAAARIKDTDHTTLRNEWLSLVVERMMANSADWPEPKGFVSTTTTRYKTYSTFFPYYQTSLSGNKTYFNEPGSPDQTAFSIWKYCGSVRGPRYDYTGLGVFTQAYADYYNSTNPGQNFVARKQYTYKRITYKQDFADIVAFQLLRTAGERETFFAQVDKMSYTGTNSQGEQTIFNCSRTLFEQKLKQAADYLKERFSWDITIVE